MEYINPKTGGISAAPFSSVSGDINAFNNMLSSIATQNNAASLVAAERQNAFQVAQNAKAMAFSSDQARINRQWQEYMSDTAHQREVSDLLAAGLNPILAANSGASTPSGSMANGVTSAGAMAQVDMNRTNALSGIAQAIMSAEVNRDNAQLNALTSMHNAEVSAKAVTDSAAIQAAASRYATDNPNTYAGLARAIFSGLTGMGIGESAKAFAEGLGTIGAAIASKLGLDVKDSGNYHYGPNDDPGLYPVLRTIVDEALHPEDYKYGADGFTYHKSKIPIYDASR